MQQQLVQLQYGSQYRQTNLATDGEDVTTTDSLYQARCGAFAVVVAQAPYKCIITGGENDLLQGETAASVKADLTSVWGKATAAGATLFACTLPPINSGDSAIVAAGVEVTAWIRTQSASYRFLIDLAAMFPDFNDPLYYLPDKAHYTALAQTLWAQAVNADLATL